ncbi:hypothetical protein [Anabaena azotica]|uniref:hypothetical protein n=1 Tax=Anabaena azotica TaxID=197653 RepID=UPI0039A5F73D
MRLLTDENFNGSILRGLIRRLPKLDVVRIQDVGLIHADDPTMQTIDQLSLRAGDRILDVCCGTGASAIPAAGTHELAAPEDGWTMVLGGGLRGTIDQLDSAARERVRQANLHFLQANEVYALEVNVLYAICLQQCFAIAQKK